MALTLCTEAQITQKAGAQAPTAITSVSATVVSMGNEAEAYFFARTRTDWVTEYSNVTATAKQVLALGVSAFAAMLVINYDTSGYYTLADAQTKLDFLDDIVQRTLAILEKMEKKEKFL